LIGTNKVIFVGMKEKASCPPAKFSTGGQLDIFLPEQLGINNRQY